MLEKIKQWAKKDKYIRAVILIGSRAEKKHDELSDYDLSLFCDDIHPFTQNDKWLSKIGKVWVCVYEKVFYQDKEFPSRLVIFEHGIKVDFSFYSTSVLKEMVQASLLPTEYSQGYIVLLDKEGTTKGLPAPNKIHYTLPPTYQEFLTVVNEFWFEAYHVAVYLKRGDVWSAQSRLSGLHHQFLLKMIEWNELSKIEWKAFTPPLGKRMQSWTSQSTWNALYRSFAHFEEKDCWIALESTTTLFQVLSQETAQSLSFQYPHDLEIHILAFIHKLTTKI